MHPVLLTALALLPPALAIVDCFTACTRCQLGGVHPALLEVHCAMCQECSARRRERGKYRRQENIVYNLEDGEECPTAPPCESDLEDPPTIPYKKLTTVISSSSTTTTTTTTTRKPCPLVLECKKRDRDPPPTIPPFRPHPTPLNPCFMPCMPMCPCPYPYPYSSLHQKVSKTAMPTQTSSPSHKTTGHSYQYVYVGVPQGVLRKIKQ